jgi:hypothetical protein
MAIWQTKPAPLSPPVKGLPRANLTRRGVKNLSSAGAALPVGPRQRTKSGVEFAKARWCGGARRGPQNLVSDDDDRVVVLRRWQDGRGLWWLMARHRGCVTIARYECDGCQEVDRFWSADPRPWRLAGRCSRAAEKSGERIMVWNLG